MHDGLPEARFMVMCAADESSMAYVEPLSVRISLGETVAALKTKIVEASLRSATPLDETFLVEMKLVLGNETLMENSRSLESYTKEFAMNSIGTPKGYMGMLCIANGVIGAPFGT